jgi:ATP synthase I chain
MRAAIASVFFCGLCFAVIGFAVFGAMAGLGVLLGGLLATANLVVFARVAQAFLARRGNTAPWGVVAVLKMVLLFGGVWLILRSGAISAISLVAGYVALPFGITIASLFGPAPPESDIPPRDRNVVKGRRSGGDEPPP